MDETNVKSAKNEKIDFLKALGKKFAMNAAASAGVTAGVMLVFRIAFPTSKVKVTSESASENN